MTPEGPRRPKPPTPERLRRRALAYLERFASGRANLRRVLLRRALREAEALGLEPGPIEAAVDALVEDMARLGLVDDDRFAEGRARALLERGRPPGRVRQALRAKGIDDAVASGALDALDAREGLDERGAALAFARRRRLGPYRRAPADAAARSRELAAFARAGFGYAVARAIVEAADAEALEAGP